MDILLIVIPTTDVRTAHFFRGVAACDDRSIRVNAEGGWIRRINTTAESLNGFDPALLPKLIVPEFVDVVLQLAKEVATCVVVFSSDTPERGVVLKDAFFGLARGRAGEPILFQGEAAPASEADEPWDASRWPNGDFGQHGK